MATVASTAVASSGTSPSNRTFPLRILVGSDIVGAIIGRSGSTIRSITQQTKARIDVHREDSPDQKEKVITISGSPESCSEACYQILKICRNEYGSYNLYNDDAQDSRDISSGPRSIEFDTLHILAPGNLIGRLIGRGGASIKKMMEQTSTKIKISVNSITESTGEHTITVHGNIERLRQAEKLISSKLRAAYTSDMNLSLQAFNQQPYLFNNVSVPYVATSSYAPHQSPLIASMVNPQTSHGTGPISRSVTMNHSHPSQINSQLYPATPAYLPFYPNVPHSAASGLVNFNSVVPRFEQERETVYIYIPSSMVGAVIGKSGIAIKEMISTSGATIKVATTVPPTVSTNHTATTSDENFQKEKMTKQQQERDTPEQPVESLNPVNSTLSKDSNLNMSEDNFSSTSSRKNKNTRSKNVNPSDDSSFRRVTVTGYPASQYTAQYLIYRKVSIESGKSDISLMVEIHVPSQLVGKIIGKGGASVKNLQKQTRTTVRLPEEKSGRDRQTSNDEPSSSSNCGNGDSETIVQITGEFEGSQAAQRHIRAMIREINFIKHVRSKPTITRNNEAQRNSNAQAKSISNERQDDQQSDIQTELGTSSCRNDKDVNDEKNEQNDKSVQEESSGKPPKAESLSPNCCNQNQADGISVTTKDKIGNTHEKKSHFVSSDSRNGPSAQVVSNNNTIANIDLKKDEPPTDATTSKSSDTKVTKSNDETKPHDKSGDTMHQTHRQVIKTGETH